MEAEFSCETLVYIQKTKILSNPEHNYLKLHRFEDTIFCNFRNVLNSMVLKSKHLYFGHGHTLKYQEVKLGCVCNVAEFQTFTGKRQAQSDNTDCFRLHMNKILKVFCSQAPRLATCNIMAWGRTMCYKERFLVRGALFFLSYFSPQCCVFERLPPHYLSR
jgi:hypothetical protein